MEGSHIWQLVDQVVLDQRAYELKAAGDDDVPVYVLLQRRDLVKHAALASCGLFPIRPTQPPALKPSSPAGLG
jgi:hypothetical protein